MNIRSLVGSCLLPTYFKWNLPSPPYKHKASAEDTEKTIALVKQMDGKLHRRLDLCAKWDTTLVYFFKAAKMRVCPNL